MSAPGSGEQPRDLLAALEASFKRPVSDEAVPLYQLSTNTFVRPIHDDVPTHIALPLSAAAQQERRERVLEAVERTGMRTVHEHTKIVDAVIAALKLSLPQEEPTP